MASAVYLLGTLTCLLCAIFLLRGYAQVRQKLLLWSGLCFIGLTISNLLVFLDLEVISWMDLHIYRLSTAAIAMAFLIFGLIRESK